MVSTFASIAGMQPADGAFLLIALGLLVSVYFSLSARRRRAAAGWFWASQWIVCALFLWLEAWLPGIVQGLLTLWFVPGLRRGVAGGQRSVGEVDTTAPKATERHRDWLPALGLAMVLFVLLFVVVVPMDDETALATAPDAATGPIWLALTTGAVPYLVLLGVLLLTTLVYLSHLNAGRRPRRQKPSAVAS